MSQDVRISSKVTDSSAVVMFIWFFVEGLLLTSGHSFIPRNVNVPSDGWSFRVDVRVAVMMSR